MSVCVSERGSVGPREGRVVFGENSSRVHSEGRNAPISEKRHSSPLHSPSIRALPSHSPAAAAPREGILKADPHTPLLTRIHRCRAA